MLKIQHFFSANRSFTEHKASAELNNLIAWLRERERERVFSDLPKYYNDVKPFQFTVLICLMRIHSMAKSFTTSPRYNVNHLSF